MNNNYLFTAVLIVLGLGSASAQKITKLTDLNPGSADSFDKFNYLGVELNGTYLLPAMDADDNSELYALENGDLTLVKDIYEGGSSKPEDLILFNNKVYFLAEDAENGREIWSSDGTTEGTQLAIDIVEGSTSGDPEDLFLASNGKLYFSSGGKAYVSDGTQEGTEEIADTYYVSFTEPTSQTSAVITNYKNGVAFFGTSGSDFRIYYHDGESLSILHEFSAGTFTDVYGLSEVSNGLLYATSDNFYPDNVGLHVITSPNNVININGPAGNSWDVYRVLEFTSEKAILLVNEGFYSTDGTQEGTVKIANGENTFYQGQKVPNVVVGDKMVFYGDEDWFDQIVFVTDGTVEGTSEIAATNSYLSPMISVGNQVFWFSGTTNGFETQLWTYTLGSGNAEMIYNKRSGLSTGPTALPLTYKDGVFYFNSLFEGDGRELFSLTSDILSSDGISYNNANLDLINVPGVNSYIITSNSSSKHFNVRQYDLNGRVFRDFEVKQDVAFTLSATGGISMIQVSNDEGVSTFKVLTK